MKKFYIISQIVFVSMLAVIIIGFSGVYENNNDLFTSTPVAKMISPLPRSSFKDVEIFSYTGTNSNEKALMDFVNKAVFLKLERAGLNRIIDAKEKNILFKIPVKENEFMELELTRVNILTNDFKLSSKSGGVINNYEHGLHYRGIIKGDGNSIASISIFRDFVMGIVSNSGGNFVLGSVKDEKKGYTDDYIFYNDADVLVKSKFNCGVGDNEEAFIKKNASIHKSNLSYEGSDNLAVDTVGIYFEADYRMYRDNGSNINLTAQFIEGMFNNVATIYQLEQIPVAVSNIAVWTSPDPYANDSNSYDILLNFGRRTQDNFMGDLAHLLSTGHNQALGGIAWINVLCAEYDPNYYAGRFAFSNIEDFYQPYPVYSWTVMVVAHEMGHNFASKHTHACVWRLPNGGTGALDSCYNSEGNCFLFPRPNYNGTIMSYCHLLGAVNLSLGFGRGAYFSQPGDTIRWGYQLASCLHYETNSSETPADYELLQNYPNPFNPATNIRFSLPEAGFVSLTLYDVLGREVVRLINNRYYSSGIFSYFLDANLYNMSSGVYFYRINVTVENASAYSEIRKMVLIK